jgi:hypothetical protein
MKSTLYIFATSARPDAYINSIAHLASRQELGRVQVVVVAEHDYPRDEEEADLATEVLASVLGQLKALSRGAYLRRQKDGSVTETVLPNGSLEIYAKCLDVLNKHGNGCLSIPYSHLETRLIEIISKGGCLFDLSALKKYLLVDVVATLVAHDFSRVYTFELLKAPTFDERDLYHSLRKEDFIYRNLAESSLVSSSLRHIRRWSARSQFLLFATAILTGLFILARMFGSASPVMDYMNGFAVVASIGSYLLQFVRGRAG